MWQLLLLPPPTTTSPIPTTRLDRFNKKVRELCTQCVLAAGLVWTAGPLLLPDISRLMDQTKQAIAQICSDPEVLAILSDPDVLCSKKDGRSIYLLEQSWLIIILTIFAGVATIKKIPKIKLHPEDEIIQLYQKICTELGIPCDTWALIKRVNQVLSGLLVNWYDNTDPQAIEDFKNGIVMTAIYDSAFFIEEIQRCSTFPIESNKPTISSDIFMETEDGYLKKIKNIIRLMLINPYIKDVYNRTQSSNQNITQSSSDNLVNFINAINTRIRNGDILHIHENNNHKWYYEPYLADFYYLNPESIPDQYESVGKIRYCLYRLYLDLRDIYRYGLFPYAPYNILINRIYMENEWDPNFDVISWDIDPNGANLNNIIGFLAKLKKQKKWSTPKQQ
jgi:hypothetical protein